MAWVTPRRGRAIRNCVIGDGVDRLHVIVFFSSQESATVSLISSRASRAEQRGTARRSRALACAALTLGMLGAVSGCGMNVQTNEPYTPSEGVNFDVGDQADPSTVVHVRNLMILSRTPGEGIVSASMVTGGSDALTSLTGTATKPDGSTGAAFTAGLATPVPLNPNQLVVLTARPLLTVQSADLAAGLSASVTLEFQKAGQITVRTTVVDATQPAYATISPAPSASTSPTPGA